MAVVISWVFWLQLLGGCGDTHRHTHRDSKYRVEVRVSSSFKVISGTGAILLLILFSHSFSLFEHINMVMCVLGFLNHLLTAHIIATQHLFIFSFRKVRCFHDCFAISCQSLQKTIANISLLPHTLPLHSIMLILIWLLLEVLHISHTVIENCFLGWRLWRQLLCFSTLLYFHKICFNLPVLSTVDVCVCVMFYF